MRLMTWLFFRPPGDGDRGTASNGEMSTWRQSCVIFRISGVSLCTTSAIHHPGRLQDHFLQQQCNRAFNHSAACTCLWPLRNLSTETEAYALATMEVGVGREREKSPIINSFSDTYSIHWFALPFPAPKKPQKPLFKRKQPKEKWDQFSRGWQSVGAIKSRKRGVGVWDGARNSGVGKERKTLDESKLVCIALQTLLTLDRKRSPTPQPLPLPLTHPPTPNIKRALASRNRLIRALDYQQQDTIAVCACVGEWACAVKIGHTLLSDDFRLFFGVRNWPFWRERARAYSFVLHVPRAW